MPTQMPSLFAVKAYRESWVEKHKEHQTDS